MTHPFVPQKKKTKKNPFLSLLFEDNVWICKLCPWADRNQISDRAFLQLLYDILLIGGIKAEAVTLSLSTVCHIRDDVRQSATLKAALKEYDDNLTVHFDGKKVKMGTLKGGGIVEHVPVNVSGVSGDDFWKSLL